MNKRLGFVTKSILTSAAILSLVASAGQASANTRTRNNNRNTRTNSVTSRIVPNNNRRTNNNFRNNNSNTSRLVPNNNFNNNIYRNHLNRNNNFGYNPYYRVVPSYNYNFGWNYNYGWNHNYGWNNFGWNNFGWNNYGWNNQGGTYRTINGSLYYILNDGTYYVYRNNQWVRGGSNNNNNRPVEPKPETPVQPKPEPKPETPVEPKPEPKPETPVEPKPEPKPETPVEPKPEPKPETPVEPKPEPKPETPVEPKPEIPSLEIIDYGPDGNIDYDKLPKPSGAPTDPKMRRDERLVYAGGEYYYYVSLDMARTMRGNGSLSRPSDARGIDGYYKWEDGRWKLYNGTASTDPALKPDNHIHTQDGEYTYSDTDSSFANFSENVIGTGKAGQALPFKNLEEFKAYVETNVKPVFKDNSGYDAKVTWSLEDASAIESYKDYALARDYVIVADLKSGVDQDGYRDQELGYVKFIFRVEASQEPAYVSLDDAKVAFDQINAERKANGLPELAWSQDLYNSTTLPHAQEISRSYSSDGIVSRRETDGKVVANKWLNSGLRDLFLSPDATEASVATVIADDGTYYWAYNYK